MLDEIAVIPLSLFHELMIASKLILITFMLALFSVT